MAVVYTPSSQDDFIAKLAADGGPKLALYGYPISAMIACACSESNYGTSDIYKLTGCPFNLQKPSDWKYPVCNLKRLSTKAMGKVVSVDFCMASDYADAARIWCEWISNWPNKRVSAHLAGICRDPEQFAIDLYMAGFADGLRINTMVFKKVLNERGLKKYDPLIRPVDLAKIANPLIPL